MCKVEIGGECGEGGEGVVYCVKGSVCLGGKCRDGKGVEGRRKKVEDHDLVGVESGEDVEGLVEVTPGVVEEKMVMEKGEKRFCLEDLECGDGRFCEIVDYEVGDGVCRLKSGVGGRCKKGNGGKGCVQDSYCGDDHRSGVEVCVRAEGAGGRCLGSEACEKGLVCEETFCKKMGSVEAGGDCVVGDVCGKGLYCPERVGEVMAKCTKLKSVGDKCNGSGGVVNECMDGFCGKDGECAALQGVGEECFGNEQCSGDGECILNKLDDKSKAGKCFAKKDIVRSRGHSCNLENDNCDTAVRLRCESKDDKAICVQQRNLACDPKNPFERCMDKEKTCQRNIDAETRQYVEGYSCQKQQFVAKKGAICTAVDETVCEEGLVCKRVTGDQSRGSATTAQTTSATTEFGPSKPLGTGYCVADVKVGGDCSNRFETKCKDGNTCIDGKCVAGVKSTTAPKVVAGLDDSCIGGKCAPGLVCSRDAICILAPVTRLARKSLKQ